MTRPWLNSGAAARFVRASQSIKTAPKPDRSLSDNEAQPQPLLDVLVHPEMAVEVKVAVVAVAALLSACGSVQCDLLGSDSLRRQCDGDGLMVTVYSTPTWYPGQTLRDLWQSDKAAQERGL